MYCNIVSIVPDRRSFPIVIWYLERIYYESNFLNSWSAQQKRERAFRITVGFRCVGQPVVGWLLDLLLVMLPWLGVRAGAGITI